MLRRVSADSMHGLVGFFQFPDVSSQAILNPGDDPKKRHLADLPAVSRSVRIRKYDYVPLADSSGFRQGSFYRRGEDGCVSFAKDEFPIIPEATCRALTKPVHVVFSTPLFDGPFHLSFVLNVANQRRGIPRTLHWSCCALFILVSAGP